MCSTGRSCGNDFGYDAPAPAEMKDVTKFEEVT